MKTFEAFITHFKDTLRAVRMQPSVREAIRERLISYADLHTVVEKTREKFSFGQYFGANLLRAGFALLLILVSAGGVAYASYDTVPGNALYSIKVSVVEPLESAMLVDAKSRATWNAILAERRLSEAAHLAVNSELSEPTRVYLQDKFEVFAERSTEAAGEVRATGDVETALMLHSDLEARLAAHTDILSYLTLENEESEPKELLAAVSRTRDRVAAERQHIESEAVGRALAYGGADLDATIEAADEVERIAATDGMVSGNIEAKLSAARSAVANARVSLAQNEQGGAFVAAQAATRFTQEASILAKNKGIVAKTQKEEATTSTEEPGTKEATTTEETIEDASASETESSHEPVASPETNTGEILDSVKSFINGL